MDLLTGRTHTRIVSFIVLDFEKLVLNRNKIVGDILVILNFLLLD